MFLVLLSDLCKGMCYLGNAQLWVASQHMPPSTTTSSLKKSRPWSRTIVGATAKSAAAKPKASPNMFKEEIFYLVSLWIGLINSASTLENLSNFY